MKTRGNGVIYAAFALIVAAATVIINEFNKER